MELNGEGSRSLERSQKVVSDSSLELPPEKLAAQGENGNAVDGVSMNGDGGKVIHGLAGDIKVCSL
jgi:hypothetical protein